MPRIHGVENGYSFLFGMSNVARIAMHRTDGRRTRDQPAATSDSNPSDDLSCQSIAAATMAAARW